MPENQDDRESLKRLVKDVVRAQGNVFIKDLLRKKQLPIGTTKTDFISNLNAAIDEGQVSRLDFEDWLLQVEGWGHQHIYLYDVPDAISTMALWSDIAALRARVDSVNLAHLIDAQTSLEFPLTPTLTGIFVRNGTMQLLWHQGLQDLKRWPGLDNNNVAIDDELYDFRAWRHSSERSVMRFELRPSEKTAAAFFQVPVGSPNHKTARDQLWETVHQLFPELQLPSFNMSEAMTRLDEEQLAGGADLRTQQARWSGQGAYVEFGATSEAHGYRDVEEIREVRLALRTMNVSGDTATMVFEAPGEKGVGREIRVQLYGTQARMWVGSQMTELQVWKLLRRIRGSR